jgi:TonB family protein
MAGLVHPNRIMAYSYGFTPRDPDRSGQHAEIFKTLEFTESRKHSLVMSIGVHAVILTVLLVVPLIFTDAIKIRYNTVLIVPPPEKKQILEVTHYKQPPQPKPEPKPVKLVAPPPAKPLLTPPPELKPSEPPKIVEVKLPEVIEREKPAPVLRNTAHLDEKEPAIAAPKIEVRTGAFSTGSSAKPTMNLPAHEVQTGGFGDPNGIKGEGKPGKPGNIASLGSFDLPVGPGAGNGTGGSKGVKGTVASAGFGNGVATVGNGGSGNAGGGGSGRSVQQGGFGDTQSAKPEAPKKRAETGPPQTPVEILYKPKPDYTDEARKMKLEGEVLVRILFTASGEVRVIEVVRGLGHGLDDSATRAAQQIKFKPAQRDGQPVDSTATVHIVFQLAY